MGVRRQAIDPPKGTFRRRGKDGVDAFCSGGREADDSQPLVCAEFWIVKRAVRPDGDGHVTRRQQGRVGANGSDLCGWDGRQPATGEETSLVESQPMKIGATM